MATADLIACSFDSSFQVEITSLDGNEIKGSYDELYVQVSAETFGKVDAAVALIELLVTPVSVCFIIFNILENYSYTCQFLH